MEDKFGYLMKSEAEDHLKEEFRALKEKIKKSDLIICHWFEKEAPALAESVRMTWGGRHSQDTEIYKIRNAQE